MTAKEKAKDLVDKYYTYQPLLSKKEAKTFALIVVKEVLNGEQTAYSFHIEQGAFFKMFWDDVKKEIEAL